MQNIKDSIYQLKELYEGGVPVKSGMFQNNVKKLNRDVEVYCNGLDINKLILYVALNCEFIFNSKKCFNFLCLLGEEDFCLLSSYIEISRKVGLRMDKKLGRCEMFIGWLQGQDIIDVFEFGNTKAKKCVIIPSQKMINEMKQDGK